MAVLALEAGVPSGVINIVTALENTPRVGQVLCSSQDVRKISFTGSTRVGKILMRQCSESPKKLSLELGGNAPFIVFDDCNLDEAVAGLMAKMKISSEETFGPVAALYSFSTEEEVIAVANDSEVGLAAYVYTNDLYRSTRVTEALQVGMVAINTGVISDNAAP
ncbi:unnamed protein product [Aureobasidium pullulans]|nr:unnamed protein product [Aureobasidium pullulans]